MIEDDIVIRAKVRLQKQSPFFSYLVQTLKVEVKEEMPHDLKSACIDDRGNLSIYKGFVIEIGEDKCIAVLCHEIMHLALDHFGRNGDRDKRLSNIAQDIVINDILVSNDFDLPEGLVPTKAHKITLGKVHITDIDKKTWEEVYEELLKGDTGEEDGYDICICDMPGSPTDKDGERECPDAQERTRRAQKLLSEAVSHAKLQGDLPAGVEERLEKLLAPKVDWKEVLSAYITKQLPYDYSFARPSRRMASTGVYMPSVVREGMEIVVALDTSGSIDSQDLREFASEVLGIATSFQGTTVHLILADCEVHKDIEIAGDYEEEIQSIKAIGGGGTSHVPVFAHINANYPDARVVVCFTDGYTEYPKDNNNFETIWALSRSSVKESEVPFGRVVKANVRSD